MNVIAPLKTTQWLRYLSSIRVIFIIVSVLVVQLFHTQVMRQVTSYAKEKRPKVLGLSATLLNANVKKGKLDFERKLKDLETTFDGKIITSKDCRGIRERYISLFHRNE